VPAPDLAADRGNGAAALAEEPPPPDDHEDRSGGPWPWIVLLLVLLIAAGGAAAYVLTRPEKAIVPVVVGEQLSTASTQIQNAGFAVQTINVTSSHPAGFVIRQDPVGGTKAKQGSTVSLTVSSGPGNASVPPVTGFPLPQAEKMIRQQHLAVGRVLFQNSSTVAKNVVISTDPNSGQPLPVGSRVNLFVSSGPALVKVPDVTGESQDSAKSQLQGDGLQVKTTTQTSSTATAGNVISQTPVGGTSVAPGSTVTLVVATAPATATVPSVVGQKAGAASGQLTGAGFTVNEQKQTVTKKDQDGVVLSQTPNGGATANKGSSVTIVVGQFKPPANTTTTPTTPTSTTPTTTSTTPKNKKK
jgi:serine/threonine-protein kinase